MRYSWLLYIFLTFNSCYQVERNCDNFKAGEFEFNYVIDGQMRKGRFIRTETLNIDYYEGKVDSATVRWINDCEYILKKINPKSNAEKDAIHIKILSTDGNSSYTFEYKLAVKKPNRPLQVERGTAYRIN